MEKKTFNIKKILIIITLCIITISIGILLCSKANIFFEENAYPQYHEIATEIFFIDRGNGTYTYAEAIFPTDCNEKIPLIAMAHGFKGTLNSGGAKEVSEKLAKAGFATIRMNFDPYTDSDKKSPQTHVYTLKSMEADMLRGIKYMFSHHNIDKNRLGLHARSMGGRVAMAMANESSDDLDFKAVTLVAPAGNKRAMIDYMGGESKWQNMKKTASQHGFILHQGQNLSPEWFDQFETYNPCDYGFKFDNKPVLVFCNTLDYVVTPQTSRECAAAYKNSRVIEVTTNNYHGYEMSYKKSELKDYIMDEIVLFFNENL